MSFRRFYLNRTVDVSGNSGTGRVAEGIVFSNGRVALCWQTENPSTTVYDNIEDVDVLHSHEGATEIVWIDEEKKDKPMEWLRPDSGLPVL